MNSSSKVNMFSKTSFAAAAIEKCNNQENFQIFLPIDSAKHKPQAGRIQLLLLDV